MRRLLFVAAAPWRLAVAVRRNGLGPVATFLALNLRRRGLAGALRMAQARRRGRIEQDQGEDAAEGQALALDLDERFALSAEAWRKWAPWIGASDADPAAMEPATVLYLVRGPAGASEAFARTRKHIRPGPGVQVLELEDAAPCAALPSGPPDRFVVFLRAGDAPDAELPREIARAARGGVAEVVSFDLFRRDGDRVFPLLAPGANPTLLRAADYLFGRAALRGEALSAVQDWAQADPRALVLDWLDGRPPMQARGRWRHLGRPLVDAAIPAQAIEVAVREARELGPRAPRPSGRRVSAAIVATPGHLTLRPLVAGLLDAADGAVVEVTVVAASASGAEVAEDLAAIATDPRARVVLDRGDGGLARLANAAARAGQAGDHLLFLDASAVSQTADWIARLLARFDDPAVGAVGPSLVTPDSPAPDYLFACSAPREVGALSGRVLMVSRSAFEAMNGFDVQFAAGLHDVDLCLRLRRSGFLNVLEPAAVMVCARDADGAADADLDRLQARWGARGRTDPHHPAGFDPLHRSLRRLSTASGRRPPMRNGLPATIG
jgi:hypothetical protein